MNDLPETLEQLSERVAALELRVFALEQGAIVAPRPTALPTAAAFGPATDLHSGEQISGAFLLLGKSLLGIAGAYLLRALAESNALPRLLIAVVAIAYAIGWLAAAARVRKKARWGAALFAGTSALILAPMLWELTMRFHVLIFHFPREQKTGTVSDRLLTMKDDAAGIQNQAVSTGM